MTVLFSMFIPCQGFILRRNISFFNSLYIGEGMDSSQLGRIKRRILNRPLFADLYLLTLAANGKDYLDIIHTKYVFACTKTVPTVVSSVNEGNRSVIRTRS